MQADKQKITRLLKTVKGQIDGLIKMVEDDRYCIEISNQILASESILKKINLEILNEHFSRCVKNALKTGGEKEIEIKLKEINYVLAKLLKF